jgi:hypothetical protein
MGTDHVYVIPGGATTVGGEGETGKKDKKR